MNKLKAHNYTKIPVGIQDSIFKYQFQYFLISQKQAKTGTTTEIINRIEANLHINSYRNQFEEFLIEQLKFGKNRLLYYSNLSISDKATLSNFSTVKSLLKGKHIVNTLYNNLLKEDPKDNDMLYLNITRTKNKIHLIELCIYKEIYNEKIDSTEINYVWIEFNVDEEYFTIRVRPLNNLPERFTPYTIYKETLIQLKSLFKLALNVKMNDAELTLYSMYKEYIKEAELPFKDMVSKIEKDIIDLNRVLLKKLPIDIKKPIFDEIVKRHSRAIERVLIVDDIELNRNSPKNNEAIIERIAVTDDSGATANVLSGDEDGLDVAHIYFDIRDTIDDITRLNKVWVKWFFDKNDRPDEIRHEQIGLFDDSDIESNDSDNEEEKPEVQFNFHSYQTKFEVKSTYVLITFMKDQFISKEVNEHVFSRFKSFEGIQ